MTSHRINFRDGSYYLIPITFYLSPTTWNLLPTSSRGNTHGERISERGVAKIQNLDHMILVGVQTSTWKNLPWGLHPWSPRHVIHRLHFTTHGTVKNKRV